MEKRSIKSIYFKAILGILLVTAFGCKDEFFEQKAGDRITPEQHYQSMIDASVSTQGPIALLQDVMPNLIMLDGLRSDMLEVTPNTNSYFNEIYNQSISKDNPVIDPSGLYKVIINVNEILANIDVLSQRDREYNELVATALKGGLITLRSWSYFTLARLYGNVAMIDGNMSSIPGNSSQTRISKNELIPMLIEELLPYVEESSADLVEYSIEHYMNTKALLGQLYLEMNNYSEAARYLKLACESFLNDPSLYKVDRSYQNEAWGAIFLNAESNGLENISVIPYSRAEDQYNPLPKWFGFDYDYMARPTSIVIDSFFAQVNAAGDTLDLYRAAFTLGFQMAIVDSALVYLNPEVRKYAVDQNDPFSSDIIISRAADLHLLLAEAYNRMGDETSQKYALMLLNQGVNSTNPKPAEFSRWSRNLGIRGRAYLSSREVPERDSIPLQERIIIIEDAIVAERALELAYEGKRWFDLVRIAERRNDPSFLADKVAEKYKGNGNYEAVRNKLMNPENWYLPFE